VTRWAAWAWAGLASGLTLASLPACQSTPFACQSDAACPDGRCESQGWCSFPDAECPSGYRFGEHAADGLASTCVDPDEGTSGPAGTTGPEATSTDAPTTSPVSATLSSTDSSGGEPPTATDTADASTSDGGDTGATGPGSTVIGPLLITDNADDGAIYFDTAGDTHWYPSGEDGAGSGFFGDVGGNYYAAYFRFQLPEALPAGADVVDARLQLHAGPSVTYDWNSAIYAVGVRIEDTDDAPVVGSRATFPVQLGNPVPGEGVDILDEMVRWPDAGGLTWDPAVNESPDLAGLVEALLAARGGLAAGAHIQLWLAIAEPTGVGGEVTYVDYAAGPAAAVAQLELTIAR
jgi:hypothetical protein